MINTSEPSQQIDVVIPAFNAAAFITQTLESVAIQGNLIGQVIVVNDGSLDDTAALVTQFAKAHPVMNLRLISQTNAGLSAARNTGIANARAQWIAFLDADDIWLPFKLSKQYALFAASSDPKLGLVYSGYSLITENSQLIPSPKGLILPHLKGSVYRQLKKGNFISGSGSAVMIKKTVFDHVGLFDEALPACEDWDMWLRIAKEFHIDYVPLELVHIRLHANNMQKDFKRMLSADLMVLNKFSIACETNVFLLWKIRTILFAKKIKPDSIAGFSSCTSQLQQQLTGLRYALACLILAPLHWAGSHYLNK